MNYDNVQIAVESNIAFYTLALTVSLSDGIQQNKNNILEMANHTDHSFSSFSHAPHIFTGLENALPCASFSDGGSYSWVFWSLGLYDK